MHTCSTAMLTCTFGAAPTSLVAVRTTVDGALPGANSLDYVPITNIPSFGLCSLTKCPCVPVTTSPWITTNYTAMIDNMPALDSNATLICSLGGVIKISSPGQTKAVL